MVHSVLFEHYMMHGKKRIEPISAEWNVVSDKLVFKATFEHFDVENETISVLQTPWGRFASETEVPLLAAENTLSIYHTLFNNGTDKADWWKGDNAESKQ